MRILLVNTSEKIGGAAVAAGRLRVALSTEGIKATLLVRDKQSDALTVTTFTESLVHRMRARWALLLERLAIFLGNGLNRQGVFQVDIANVGLDITQLPEFKQADVIHLHWINQGMLSLGQIKKILRSGKPVVWTMHDMWPCTAICHHAVDCTAFHQGCHDCMYLGAAKGKHDLSAQVYRRKQKCYQEGNIHFVACSEWLGNHARQSGLITPGHVHVIPNPISLDNFKPGDVDQIRASLHLPIDKRYILFGAVKTSDENKGVHYFIEACRLLKEMPQSQKDQWAVLVMGRGAEELLEAIPLEAYSLPFVTDSAKIVQYYQAADLFVTPSLQENLPNMIMESMACGLPCVGFKVGGIPEMIRHQVTGYLAEYKDAADLASGIRYILKDTQRYRQLSHDARAFVRKHYSESVVAQQYERIYQLAIQNK